MSFRCQTHPTHDSIFGDTYHGVPNPLVPHKHPYPTRYHGTILTWLEAGLPYMEQNYAVVPYAGFGEDKRVLAGISSMPLADAAIGAAFGYLLARDNHAGWAVVGAAATGLLGAVGLIGTAGAMLLSQKQRKA